jgi:hypothetical protein
VVSIRYLSRGQWENGRQGKGGMTEPADKPLDLGVYGRRVRASARRWPTSPLRC